MTTENEVRILNCIPSENRENDWSDAAAEDAGILTASPLPEIKDLRESWWKIGDQGSTGSCVGWAAADSVVRWHFVQQGRIRKNEKLSVRYVWMASKETDEFVSRPTTFIERDGTSLKAALDVVRKYGVVRNKILPFHTNKLSSLKTETFYAIAAELKIASYFKLPKRVNRWKRWLADSGPILTRLNVDGTWQNATNTNGYLDSYDDESAEGGHAVALVGYTPDYFIVRNSWGDDWGDGGFAYASYAYALQAFDESYGVRVV